MKKWGWAACLLLGAAGVLSWGQPAYAAAEEPVVEEGVYAGEVEVSGMTREEALAAVNSYYQELAASPFTVTADGQPVETTLAELGGVQQTLEHMRAYPEVIREALQKVTDTTINYMQEAMKLDLGGFFFTSRYCSSDYMSLEEYRVFGEYYDRQLFRVFEGKTGFNMNHIHGANTYWDFLAQYPFECVNWHDTWIPPTLEDARRKTEKCLCGGLSEKEMLPFGTPEQIKAQIRDVVRRAGARGLMITNGCGTFPTPSFANMQAVTDGVRELELAF